MNVKGCFALLVHRILRGDCLKTRYFRFGMAIIGLLILIFDPRTAIAGIQNGIQVCLQSAIPSLLPFIIVTKYLIQHMYGSRIPVLEKVGRICGVPQCMESVYGICLIGGYPIGAQLVVDAMNQKKIDKNTAERMMGFCNNSGPAFIFGVCGNLFNFSYAGWLILLIQISSSVLCGMILPKIEVRNSDKIDIKPLPFAETLEASIRAMTNICGWILCFKVVISYIDVYLAVSCFDLRAVIYGILELMNGCMWLKEVKTESLRFIFLNGMLSFGGICVWMQISAIAKDLSMKCFYVGKVLQSIVSLSLAGIIQFFLFKNDPYSVRIVVISSCMLLLLIAGSIDYVKKIVAFLKKVMYHNRIKDKLRYPYAVPKEN